MRVEKLVYGGDGLARLDGRVVLAPFVLPGETVRLEAAREKSGLVHARLLEVVQPAPGRLAAPCPYFGRCGGCHYQHAPYELQLRAKLDILVEVLRRTGRIDPPVEIATVAAGAWGYRNRVRLHVRGNRLGYLEAGSHKLCAIEECPIGSPRVNEVIAVLNGMLRDRRWPPFVREMEVFTDERQVQLTILETDRGVARRFFDWCAGRIAGWVENELEYSAAGELYQVSRHSFFQVNRLLIDTLVKTAVAGAAGGHALDLYAGVGLFSLPLARRFARVDAVEAAPPAARDLVANAIRAGVEVRVSQSAVEAYLDTMENPPDFVLADPPRAGLGRAVVARLNALAPPRITIVACDPATLARDLAGLVAGGYRIDAMTMIDLFPQTYHLETVVSLVR